LAGGTLTGIKVAILPTGGPDPLPVAESIGRRLDPDGHGLTVLVFEGHSWGAASNARCGVGSLIQAAVNHNLDTLRSSNDVTSAVADFAAAVRTASDADHGCSGDRSDNNQFGAQAKRSSHTGLYVVAAIALALLLGVAYFGYARRRRTQRQLADARAQVVPYYDRLASEISGIDPKDNATARQALADATQRLSSAKRQLTTANSVAQYEQAGHTVLEGLYAARTARTALGLDPGPPLPPITTQTGAQLDQPREVTVQGQTFQGYPSYMPGAPYFFGGGYGVPGGWYSVPFWETLLVGSVLAGGLGGWGSGWGAYDAGYDTGFNAGEAAADDQRTDDSGAAGSDAWGDSSGAGTWDGSGWGDGADLGGGLGGGGDWGGGGDSSGSW
jgi:hypothetical protein